jgi:branched-subunit amino acid transport protein
VSNTELWITLIALGAISFAVRYFPMMLLERFPLPGLQKVLKYVPAATLAGLVLPALIAPKGQWDISLGNEYLWAGLLAAVVAWRFKQVVLTLLVGLLALALFRVLG